MINCVIIKIITFIAMLLIKILLREESMIS